MKPYKCSTCGNEYAARRSKPEDCPNLSVSEPCPIERQRAPAPRAYLLLGAREYELRDGSVLGRNGEGSSKLRSDVSVSREHARVRIVEGCWVVQNISRSQSPLAHEGRALAFGATAELTRGMHRLEFGTMRILIELEIR